MAGIAATLGIGSGKLTGDTLEKLKAADRAAQVKPTERRIEEATKKTEQIATLNQSISEVQQSQTQLSNEVSYQKRKPSVTGDSVSVTVDDGVPIQNLSFDVKKLAQNDIYESKGFVTRDDVISDEDTLLTFSTAGKDYSINIAGGTTLKQLPALLEKQTEGQVTGTLLDTGGPKPIKMLIKSKETGLDSKINFGDATDSYEVDMSNFPINIGKGDIIVNGVNIFDEAISIADLYDIKTIDSKEYQGLEVIVKKINDKSNETGVSATLSSNGASIILTNIKGQQIDLSGDNDVLNALGLKDAKKLIGNRLRDEDLDFDFSKDFTIKDKNGEDVIIFYEGDNVDSLQEVADRVNDKFNDGKIDVNASVTIFSNGEKSLTFNVKNGSSSELKLNGDAGNLSQLGIATSQNTFQKGTEINEAELDFNLNQKFTINDKNGANITVFGQGENISDLEDVAYEINRLFDRGMTDIKAYYNKTDGGKSYLSFENVKGGEINLGVDDNDLKQMGLYTLENVINTQATSNTSGGTKEEGNSVDFKDVKFGEDFTINGTAIYESGDYEDEIEEIVKKINSKALSTGVIAHLTKNYDETAFITLENKQGENIEIDGLNEDLNKFGLAQKTVQSSSKSLGILGLTNIQRASDASIEYNGARITRKSNEIDDLAVGVKIKLLDEGKSTINIARDFEVVNASVKSFVEAYNALGKNIEALTKYDKEKGTVGVFQGISEVSTIMHKLNQQITKYHPKLEIKSMMELGIDINKEGIMSLDESKLSAAMSKSPEDVESLLRGFYKDLKPTTVSTGDIKKDGFNVGFGSSMMLKINGHTFFTKSDDTLNIKYNSGFDRYDNLNELAKKINAKTDITNIEADVNENKELIIRHLKGNEINFDGSNEEVLRNLGLYGKRAFAVKQNFEKGVFTNINDYFDSLVDGDNALLTRYSKGLDDNLKKLEEEKARSIERLDTKYETMANQFASYDSMMSEMKNSFNSLDMIIKQSVSEKK